jgi:hypothetical protein
MPSAEIIAETFLAPEQIPPWTGLASSPPHIRLWHGATDDEIAAFWVALARYNQCDSSTSFTELAYLALLSNRLLLPGGLRVVAGDQEIMPGCCCGVETWREQLGLLQGEPVWMGHDPDPWAEVSGSDALLWPDRPNPAAGQHPDGQTPIRIPLGDAPTLAAAVEHDMAGFAHTLRAWTFARLDAARAQKLMDRIEKEWQLAGPLPPA